MADLEGLKNAFTQVVAALNTLDATAFADLLHEEVVIFGHTSPFPVDGRAAVRQGLQAVFAQRESETVTLINAHYR